MPAQPIDRPTIVDVAKRTDPDGKIARIAELLSQSNPLINDLTWLEGNLPTGHRMTMRTGLPEVYFRMANQAVPSSKSETAQVDVSTAIIEARSTIDEVVAELNGNVGNYRISESQPFYQSLSNQVSTSLWYGDQSIAPEQFTGLSPQYSSFSAPNARNLIDGGGVGADNASIWLIGHGSNTAFGIYPKGSQAGLKHDDFGKVTITDVNGNRMEAYEEKWQWKCGFALRDWRYVARICNIDVDNLRTNSNDADLTELMITAVNAIQDLDTVKPIFYMNRAIFHWLTIQRRRTMSGFDGGSTYNGGSIQYQDIDGKYIPTFMGIPIRERTDSLLTTEARVQ